MVDHNKAATAPAAPAATPDEILDFELADEQQILDELQGRQFEKDKFIYAVRGGHQLTYKGVKYACRLFEERGEVIEVRDKALVTYDPKDPEYILVQVVAQRVKIDHKTGQRIVLGSEIGAKRKWIKEYRKDQTVHPDPFFFEKAVSQAQRNAKLALLPQDFVIELIKIIQKGERQPGAPSKSQQSAQSAGAAKPAGQAKPQGQQGQQQTRQAAPPAGGAAKPAGAAKPQKPADPLSTLRQQFWAVLRVASGDTKDEAKQRALLKSIVGKDRVSDLDEAVMRKVGPLLRMIGEGECTVQQFGDVTAVVHAPSSEIRWPEGFTPPEAESTGDQASDRREDDSQEPPPGSGEPLF